MELVESRTVNIVADFRLPGEVQLASLALAMGAEYEPEIHSNAYLKLPCGATAILHKKGRVALAEVRDVDGLGIALAEVRSKLSTVGIEAGSATLRICNIVISGSFSASVDLGALARRGVADDEPEAFPGAYVRACGAKELAIVYASGKFVMTGLKSLETVSEHVESLRVLLEVH